MIFGHESLFLFFEHSETIEVVNSCQKCHDHYSTPDAEHNPARPDQMLETGKNYLQILNLRIVHLIEY